MMLPSVCVATLRGCTARPASRLRWCRPTTGVAVDGVPSPAGANLRSSAPTNDQDASSANDVPLGRRRVVDITQVADRLSERS